MQSRHIGEIESLLEIVARQTSSPAVPKLVPSVSSWSMSQQLDHILKVANATLGAVVAAKPLEKPAGMNVVGRAVMLIGWIPRGRAKAPERLHGIAVSSKELLDQVAKARALLAKITDPSFQPAATPVLRHPYLGGLTAAQTLRFVVVHTRHHLKIVRDIENAR